MKVDLFKKKGTYTDKEGKEKMFTNFYIKCGDMMIPVEPKYFPNPKCSDRDPQFAERKGAMEAFADILPDKEQTAS